MTVCCANRVVAAHERCWAKHQTITDPIHRAAAERLRELPEANTGAPELEVEQRSPADYD